MYYVTLLRVQLKTFIFHSSPLAMTSRSVLETLKHLYLVFKSLISNATTIKNYMKQVRTPWEDLARRSID